jgi:hypothetical protein
MKKQRSTSHSFPVYNKIGKAVSKKPGRPVHAAERGVKLRAAAGGADGPSQGKRINCVYSVVSGLALR